jgi:hypothetical protein
LKKGEGIKMRRDVKIEDDYANHKLSIIFPKMCSICQSDSFEPAFLFGVFVKGDSKSLFMESVFQCTNIKCNSLIIGYYKRANTHVPFELINVSPMQIKEKKFSPEIKEVSPRFVQLFNQLFIAEEKNIEIILGIGYRKAFEFLLKDFLVYIDPKAKEKLVNASLVYCLNKIDNKNISVISNKVSWLGNEEDQFTREWTGKDINDLKKMIDVTSSYITANIKLRKHVDKLNE